MAERAVWMTLFLAFTAAKLGSVRDIFLKLKPQPPSESTFLDPPLLSRVHNRGRDSSLAVLYKPKVA